MIDRALKFLPGWLFAFSAVAADESGGVYYAKIICPDEGCPVERIRRRAEEVVVEGPGYVVVKMKKKQTHLLGFLLYKTGEADYIRRFLRVNVRSKKDINFLGDVGMDIFHVGEEHVIGGALDGTVRKIEDEGLEYEFIPEP